MNLTANASRLGLRIQETFSEHAREFNLSVSSNAALFDTPDAKISDIRQQLDGSSDRETLEGLKRLIAVGVLLSNERPSVSFDVDGLQRPRCIPILRTSCQKCCIPQSGNPETRLYLYPAIRRVRTRPRLALNQYVPKGPHGQQSANSRNGFESAVKHPGSSHIIDCCLSHKEVLCGCESLRAQNCCTGDTEVL
jgi:hypothetical protein